MRTRIILAALLCGLVLSAGCTTPAGRIKRNPGLFASFPPEIQENVKQGKIEIGYDRDMVYIALGDPDRRYSRRTSAGDVEVWAYVDAYTTTERQRVDGPFRYRDADGTSRTIRDTLWVDVQQRHEYETFRVEFTDSKVSAIEEFKR